MKEMEVKKGNEGMKEIKEGKKEVKEMGEVEEGSE